MKRVRFLPLVESPLLEPYEEEPAAIPQPDKAMILKLVQSSVSGDFKRAAAWGEAPNTDVWNPLLVCFPAFQPSVVEDVPRAYLERFLKQQRGGQQRCVMGELCQGRTLATLLSPDTHGFFLPVFVTPQNRRFADLCVLCLMLAQSRNHFRGRPHTLFNGLPPFKLSALRYGEDGLEFVQ